jgi:Zn-dependent M28 family amino/carboxypeptidase
MNRSMVTNWLVASGAVLAFSACAAPSAAPSAAPPAAAATTAPISAEDMRTRIYFLASDGLRGRDTPSPGLEAAAAYLVSEATRLGLEPAGENDTFYQRWPFRGAEPPNVVAVLRGADPALRDEYVILSAHFDHVGVGRPMNGDSIYNGADDNASGTSALLEVARAMAALPNRPRRSVAFLWVSGEEKGLLGSRWYSENPTLPLERTVANINVDMIASDRHRDSVVVIGKDYSTLGELVDRVNARLPELGLVAADDIWPEQRFFFRSDHFNFARKEVPAIFFFTGVHECYHRPCDTVDFIDPDKAARVANLILHTTLKIANADRRPQWDPAGLEEVRSLTR